MDRALRSLLLLLLGVLALTFAPAWVMGQVADWLRGNSGPAGDWFVFDEPASVSTATVMPQTAPPVSSDRRTADVVGGSSGPAGDGGTPVVSVVEPADVEVPVVKPAVLSPADDGLGVRQSNLGVSCWVDGSVWCEGWRAGLGAESIEVPREIVLPGVVSGLVVGPGHQCASVVVEGRAQLWCWGEGYEEGVGYTGRRFADLPVLLWEGRHIHGFELGHRSGRLHAGFDDGSCGWVSWGETPDRVMNVPE